MEKRSPVRLAAGFAGLLAALTILIIWNINTGSVRLPVREIVEILFRRTGENVTIVWNIRLPRTIAALILGGALALSGFLLQTFFANPIAGPFVLGISSGAKLVLSLVLIGLLSRGIAAGSWTLILAAFLGATMSMGFVLAISLKAKRMSLLIICGVMIGYICSAITDFVVTFADDANIVNLHHWSLGSFSGMSWENVGVMTAVVVPALILTFLLSKPISAYQLGEVYARNMGVNIRVFRAVLILLSSVLSACVTAFAGPISFVGVAVPHLIRSIFKTAKPIVMVPACFLGGAVFCLFCDLIARTIVSPAELSISSVTAVFGAPVVIFVMLRRQKDRS
ncbi:MAG: iron ABC transporter permease [Lachnospiraceae bacterium]|nr:iron ABC transporter permease [Lachnospiraceae bacterium]